MIVDILFLGVVSALALRGVHKMRTSRWAGPGSHSRSSSGQRQPSFRGERKRMWEQAKVTDWLKQRDHDRKNGTTAPSRGRRHSDGFASVTRIDTRKGPRQPAAAAAGGRGARWPLRLKDPAPTSPGPPPATGYGGGLGQARQNGPPAPPPPAAPPSPSTANGSSGRTATMAAAGTSTGAAEQLIQGINQIHAAAASGNIHAKHAAIKAYVEGAQRFSATMAMLGRQLAEPGMHYGPEITEPLNKMAVHLQAAAMAGSESDTALTTLLAMSVGDLANSGRQAPHYAELSENGSR